MSIDERRVTAGWIDVAPSGEALSLEASPEMVVEEGPMVLREENFLPLPKALPVDGGERVSSVDVIRGVALMGILAMNIVGMAWPGNVYGNPIAAPGYSRADLWLWGFNHVVFDTKMMTLFSMLFGGGLVLMSDRADGRGAKMRGVYYRRVAWLLVIGLVHAYLIWDGDILVMYASVGLLLYPIRQWSARTLLIVGVCLNLVLVPLWAGFRFGAVPFMEATAMKVEAQVAAKETPVPWEKRVAEAWKKMAKPEKKSAFEKREVFLEDLKVMRGGYAGIVKNRALNLFFGQTLGFVMFAWWFVGGRMLIGMGLMKLGVFSARLSVRSYAVMMAVGYGLGLPLMIFDAVQESSHGFFPGQGFQHGLEGWFMITMYGSMLVVFGHIGLVMLACKTNTATWLTRRLGAAGRMALSCYLFDSIVGTTLFYGYGFDFAGSLYRPLLYAIVLTIWTTQLLVCPLWLEKFRFGPAEWLWRSLTYWKFQSMKPRAA